MLLIAVKRQPCIDYEFNIILLLTIDVGGGGREG